MTEISNRPDLVARNAKIRQARQQGRSYDNIAAEFGLSRESVRQACLEKEL
jgi:hypothetical protein